ncbi:hypothetical protein GQ53DRAFT_852643 [Thozetella sp. PMI_491]|nr:hypothetical protein GQ53DRAFT_852643 [Thozetella sp. PMI_491]
MRVVLLVISFLATTALSMWDRDVWGDTYTIGGPNGGAFTLVGEAGTVVKKIRVFRRNHSKQYLRGLRVFFSDNTEAVTGVEQDEYQEFEFQDGEHITSMTLWGDGVGKRTGRIRFATDQNRQFDYGQNTDGQREYAMPLSSGILIGFIGGSGSDIDRLSPVFLKPLKDTYFDDIKFSQFDANKGLTLKTLKEAEVVWEGSPFTFHFGGSEELDTATTWSFTVSDSLTISATVTAGVPEIAQGSLTTSWTVGVEASHSGTETDKTTLSWNMDVKLDGPEDSARQDPSPPHYRPKEVYWEGKLDVDWTGTLVMVTSDGRTYRFPTNGSMKRVAVSKIIPSCEKLLGQSSTSSEEATKVTIASTSGYSKTTTGISTVALSSSKPATGQSSSRVTSTSTLATNSTLTSQSPIGSVTASSGPSSLWTTITTLPSNSTTRSVAWVNATTVSRIECKSCNLGTGTAASSTTHTASI